MNQTQRNYAIERVKRAAYQKARALEDEQHRSPPPPTLDDVHDALKSGKAKLKSKKALQDLMKERNRYGGKQNPIKLTLDDAFTGLPKPKAKKIDSDTLDKKRNEIYDRLQVVTDEIMLGDETKAMKMIADFEKELAKK